ncbi:MFS transporter [Gloeocapsopsis sp. IPPAS B-1203]|uniref:MFS transporter n=1 Tax=Gloeocapsopsis sp. IPPAS B-1203 TaxID=2049454 RepID=UPI000C195B13|nr:MFS transporter [Gloeocapsopsis sp. IPPAS B-1203]PIG91445.1 MFS transporter [Gloeocapsopsis sp. IPPAS B-1203]
MLRDPKLIVLLLAGSLTTMTGGVIAPVLPEMIQQLHFDPSVAAHLVSIHCLTIALSSPLLGILADKVGPLWVLVPSLLLYALFGTVGAVIQTILPLLVSRALLGVASGGIAAASLGLLGKMYEGQKRSQALAYATTTLTIAGILFPLLGGWLGNINWRFTFGLYSLGIPLAVVVVVMLRQQTQPTKVNQIASNKLGRVLGDRRVIGLLLTLGVASIVMYTVVIYAPLYFKATMNAGAALNGIILAARAIGAAIVSAFAAKRLLQSLGTARATAVGFALMAVTLATLPLLKQLYLILFMAGIFGAGFGIVLPSLYSALADVAPVNLRSSILALGTGAGFLGQFFSPILLSPVLDSSGLPSVFYTAASLSAAIAIPLIWFSNDGRITTR